MLSIAMKAFCKINTLVFANSFELGLLYNFLPLHIYMWGTRSCYVFALAKMDFETENCRMTSLEGIVAEVTRILVIFAYASEYR